MDPVNVFFLSMMFYLNCCKAIPPHTHTHAKCHGEKTLDSMFGSPVGVMQCCKVQPPNAPTVNYRDVAATLVSARCS